MSGIDFSRGLILHAPTGVTVNLYTGLAKGETELVSPAFSEEENGITPFRIVKDTVCKICPF